MSPVSATPDRSSMNGSVEYRALNVGFVPTNIADRMPAVGREPPHALPDTGHSAPGLGHMSRPIRDAGSLRSMRSSFRDIINLRRVNRTPSWTARDISAVLNNLQISAARWRFSTCCKNPCADMSLTRQWCRGPLSCLFPLRRFFAPSPWRSYCLRSLNHCAVLRLPQRARCR